MDNSKQSKQVLLSVIGVAILVVAVVGVSFAFFNYTRTGNANQVTTGTISFSSENTLLSLSNVFPVALTNGNLPANDPNVASGTVTITGNTNYSNGIDFKVTAVDVSSNIGTAAGKLPLSVKVTANDLTAVKAFGSNSGSITVNSYDSTTTIAENSVLAQGRIPAGTSVNGSLTIQAYIDQDRVAITDTVQGGNIVVNNYTNGTTSTWIDGRTVLTTAEWNALASTPASFKFKVEANEGAA